MDRIGRRRFIITGTAGLAGVSAITPGLANTIFAAPKEMAIDKVKLGETGLVVPRLALGTGTNGFRRESNQTRLGMSEFVKMANHAYDRGIRFYDTADTYGSHIYAREAIKGHPREELTILSKIWTSDNEWYKTEDVGTTLGRVRKELGTEYLDILLLHCMVNGEWKEQKKRFIDGFNEAKQKGIVKKVGLSCHNFEALKVAADDEWPDVILARINHTGAKMDGTPAQIMALLETARKNGKGVIGMKIFGCGDLTADDQREKSLKYVLESGNVHSMTIGFENIQQIDDTVERVMRIARL